MNKSILLIIFTCFCFSFTQAQSTSTKKIKSNVTHLTKKAFLKKVVDYQKNPKKWVYIGDKPCIIDFYASWCGPCKRIAPILEKLAKKYEGEIYIYKVNTGVEKELSQDFAIQSLPTIIFCPMKGKPTMAKGALPEESIVKIIEKQLLPSKKN